jgi:integrase
MLKEPKPRDGLLAHEKYSEFLNSLRDYLKPVLAIGYHTGMRKSDVTHLKWSDVDLVERVIRLRARETKNDEPREIPISDGLYAVLCEQFRKRDPRFPFVCFR